MILKLAMKQKVVEDSLKRLPIHTLYKEFRFVDPKIVLTKSNITLDCTIKTLNYLLMYYSFGITYMSLKTLMIVAFLRT